MVLKDIKAPKKQESKETKELDLSRFSGGK